MQHRGEIVEKAVRQSGYSITKLVNRLGKSRRWIYNAFDNANLSIDYILEIGRIIHYDFSKDLDVMRDKSFQLDDDSRQIQSVSEVIDWRMKYYELLEKYNSLLERVNQM